MPDKRKTLFFHMDNDHKQRRFRKARDNRSNRSTRHTHRCKRQNGKPFIAEDKDIIENKVYDNCQNACRHRKLCFSQFSQRTAVDLRDGKRDQPNKHNAEIIQSMLQRGGGIGRRCSLSKIHRNHLLWKCQKYSECNYQHGNRYVPFHPEAVTDTLLVVRTRILNQKNTRAGQPAENAKIKYQQKLIDDGYRRHLNGSDGSYHNVVQ